MVKITYDDLEKAGATSADFVKRAANATANYACELYRDYPWAMTGGQPYGFAKGVWDTLCERRPAGLPAAPPAAPYSGGQCPVAYGITITIRYKPNSHNAIRDTYHNLFQVWGSISSVNAVVSSPSSQNEFGVLHDIEVGCKGQANVPPTNSAITVSLKQFGHFQAIESIVINRLDNQPDNCGDLPVGYPTIPVPPNKTSGDVVIPSPGGNITLPIVLIPGVGFDANFKLADTINFRFDFDGVSAEVRDSIKDLQDAVKELLDRVPKPLKPPTSEDYNANESSEENSGDEDNIEGLKYVLVDLTVVPRNAKKQSGGDAQDIIYSGWFQFLADGYYFPREPIHFTRSLFAAPPGCTGYAYTLYEGYQATITEIREEPPTEEAT